MISDLKDIFADLDVGVTDWTLSAHAGVVGRHREPVRVVNEMTWKSIGPEMVTEFDRLYGNYLGAFDGFICTYPPAFIPLFVRYEKPIIGVVATRYEHPFTANRAQWSWLDSELRRACASGQLTMVANNRGDRDYLKHFTGLDCTLISSLCRYPRAPFTGGRPVFAISAKAPELSALVERGTASAAQARSRLFKKRASWAQMHDVQGWVHIPYNISQMTFFEQYFAGVPIYMPDDRFLLELQSTYPDDVLSELSFFQIQDLNQDDLPSNDPNKTSEKEVLRWWIDRADFAPGGELDQITRFGSMEELSHLLHAPTDAAAAERYREDNIGRERRILSQWRTLLEGVFAI